MGLTRFYKTTVFFTFISLSISYPVLNSRSHKVEYLKGLLHGLSTDPTMIPTVAPTVEPTVAQRGAKTTRSDVLVKVPLYSLLLTSPNTD